MLPSLSPAARCLNALLRYELAAVRCHRFAAAVLPADRETLTAVRRLHELAAATLRQRVVLLGQPPSDGPGLWDALPALVEASTALSARWAVLRVLRGAERHGIETYESACRIPALPAEIRVAIESTLLPLMHGNVRTLEQLDARPTRAARLA
ncbi:MAG TPA: hypothetical protein VFG68_01405 [Fimbriiglobus sp.]|nr:hypothetical protein [Fimbriiglobus sp.]